MQKKVYILDAKRTPIAKFGGNFVSLSAPILASQVINDIFKKRLKLKNKIDEVIIGNVLSTGLGQNPARIAAMKGGLSKNIPSYTVNKVCGSGLQSIINAAQAIELNNASLILAGGMESMSNAPYYLQNRFGNKKFGDQKLQDSILTDAIYCSLTNQYMGKTAELLAKKYSISRKDQDTYALKSHQKAIRAIKTNKFKKEIIPIKINNNNYDTDEQPRVDTSIEKLNQLLPAFHKNGTVTAGNSSSLNDGAAITLIASEKTVKKYRLKPMAKIINYCSVALDPKYMGLGAYYAIKKLLIKSQMKKSDIDLWEINEAFAAQILSVLQLLGINEKNVNVNGGAIALGHPVGASGTRILTTLIYELKRQKLQFGIASLCIGGGQGISILIENIN